jgi:biopolymer transport protein ExbD
MFFLAHYLPDLDYMRATGSYHGVRTPEIRNGKTQPLQYKGFPLVYVDYYGNTYFGDQKVEDLSKLPQMVKDKIQEKKDDGRKILVKIHPDVPYGLVTRILDGLSKAGIATVGLMGYDYSGY